jgi:ornithine racemase
MVEMGDLREGVVPYELPQFIRETLYLPNLKIIGVGCILACYG